MPELIPLPPVDVVELLPGERAHLLDLLSGLTDEEWQAPTACPGWSVRDVALHLLGDDVGVLSWLRDGFVSPLGAEIGRLKPDFAGLVALIDRSNADWLLAARRISPRLLIELLRLTGEETAACFAARDPDIPSGVVAWASPEPAPGWLSTAREYTERWVHQQHIRDAVGRPGLKEPRWLAPVLATFVRALPRALASVDAASGASLRLEITGPAGGVWWAVREPAGWVLAAARDGAPDATASLDQESAWRLFTRGLTSGEAARAVRTGGDPSLAGRVIEVVSIMA